MKHINIEDSDNESNAGEVSLDDPSLEIVGKVYGYCLMEGQGRIRGLEFGFRAMGDHWVFEVMSDPVDDEPYRQPAFTMMSAAIFRSAERIAEGAAIPLNDGMGARHDNVRGMPHDVAKRLIHQCAREYLNALESSQARARRNSVPQG